MYCKYLNYDIKKKKWDERLSEIMDDQIDIAVKNISKKKQTPCTGHQEIP